MSEPAWMRQPSLACEFCGGPGYYFVAPPPISLAFSDDPGDLSLLTLDRHVTCPEHRWLVEQKLKREQDPERFAYEHQTPLLTDAQRREMLRDIANMLEQTGDPDLALRAARFRALSEQ